MLELIYEKKDSIPEVFRADGVFEKLFTETPDGKISLTGVTGMKTQKDVDTISEALRKERSDHKAAIDKLKPWGDLNPTETLAQLDRIKELEAAAGGKLDEEKINEIVQGRLSQSTAPLQREIETLSTTNSTLQEENKELRNSIESRDRNDSVRSVATESKAHPTAAPDIEMAASYMLEKNDAGQWVVKDGISGVTPGLDVKGWLKEMQKLRPHWWPESEGGGALGNGPGSFTGDNPFAAKTWNVTAQSQLISTQGMEVAKTLASRAGTTVGGGRPTK